MESDLDVLVDQSDLLDDVIVHVLFSLVEVLVIVVKPRAEHGDVLEEDVFTGDVDLEGKIFVRNSVLDVPHSLPECLSIDGLDLCLEVALDKAHDGVDMSRHGDLELDPFGQDTVIAQLLERLIARNGVVVVLGLARTGLDLVDARLDLLRGEVVHDKLRVHLELRDHLRRRLEEELLELDEVDAVARLAVGDAAQAVWHTRATSPKDIFGAVEGHGADEMAA